MYIILLHEVCLRITFSSIWHSIHTEITDIFPFHFKFAAEHYFYMQEHPFKLAFSSVHIASRPTFVLQLGYILFDILMYLSSY